MCQFLVSVFYFSKIKSGDRYVFINFNEECYSSKVVVLVLLVEERTLPFNTQVCSLKYRAHFLNIASFGLLFIVITYNS